MKKNLLMYTLVVLGLALGTCASAYGMAFGKNTPEIDPSLAITGLTLLGGSLAVLRARRKK
jgi:LPXTG-motif cell wall-anchored protein